MSFWTQIAGVTLTPKDNKKSQEEFESKQKPEDKEFTNLDDSWTDLMLYFRLSLLQIGPERNVDTVYSNIDVISETQYGLLSERKSLTDCLELNLSKMYGGGFSLYLCQLITDMVCDQPFTIDNFMQNMRQFYIDGGDSSLKPDIGYWNRKTEIKVFSNLEKSIIYDTTDADDDDDITIAEKIVQLITTSENIDENVDINNVIMKSANKRIVFKLTSNKIKSFCQYFDNKTCQSQLDQFIKTFEKIADDIILLRINCQDQFIFIIGCHKKSRKMIAASAQIVFRKRKCNIPTQLYFD